jgi:6-phosphogluconolactonase
VDERCVPPQNEQSNYGQFKKNVLDPLNIANKQIHAIDGTLSPEMAANQYQELLHSWAEPGQDLPRFDWVLLGMGNDGHTASLFPGQSLPLMLHQAVIPVIADYEGRPSHRVTLTPIILNLARQVVFMVSGLAKAKILQEVLQGDHDPLRIPAQRIQPVEGRLVWMIDEAAASQL